MPRLSVANPYRFRLASPLAFENYQEPTDDELNANPDNDPHGLIWDLTCALDTNSTTFTLGDPELDESLSFCQEAGSSEPMSYNPEIAFQFFRATEEGRIGDPTKYNTAHLAFTLLAARGVEYFAVMSVGKDPSEPFAPGDEVKIAEVATDWGIDVVGSGENARMNQDFANRSRVAWNVPVVAA